MMGITVLHWHANSLNGHAAELKNYIKNSKTVQTLFVYKKRFLNLILISRLQGTLQKIKCRKNGKGGVATFIRDGIEYSSQAVSGITEAVEITITANNQKIEIHNIYISPNCETDIDYLAKTFEKTSAIICGDLNAKNTLWGSPENDERGKLIGDLIEENNVTVLNTTI